MTQATLLSEVANEIVGNPVRLFSPDSVTLQFTSHRDGFSACVLIEIAMAQNVSPGNLWYSIATIGLDPWFTAADLKFSRHTQVIVFSLHLDPGALWIRTSVVEYSRGTVSAYIAY